MDSKGLSYKTCKKFRCISASRALTLLVACMLARTTWMLELVIRASCLAMPVTRPPIICPLTRSMATRLGKTLTEVRKSGECWWLRPDGKTQVTIEYLQHPDGSVVPKEIHTVVISTQHAEPLKAKRTKEWAGYTGPEMTTPSMEAMNKEIEEKRSNVLWRTSN